MEKRFNQWIIQHGEMVLYTQLGIYSAKYDKQYQHWVCWSCGSDNPDSAEFDTFTEVRKWVKEHIVDALCELLLPE